MNSITDLLDLEDANISISSGVSQSLCKPPN